VLFGLVVFALIVVVSRLIMMVCGGLVMMVACGVFCHCYWLRVSPPFGFGWNPLKWLIIPLPNELAQNTFSLRIGT
jgi:hypothetical protein